MAKKILSVFLCAVIAFAFTSCADSKNDSKEQSENKPELVYNAFDSAYSSYDASTVSAYADLCKAVCAGESNVRFNLGMFDNVMQLFYTSFPLNVLVKDIKKNDDGSGITITYKYDKSEVIKKSDSFTKQINDIVKKSKNGGENERVFAINAYNYTASNTKKTDAENQTVYNTIMTGEGSAQTIAGMLSFILRQGGLTSSQLIASDAGGAGWGVCLAELDGENYLFDPATETIVNGGKQLVYFGMTTEDAQKEGLSDFIYTNKAEAPTCDNPYFDTCRQCKAWEISDDDKALLITQNNDEIVRIAL